LIIETGFRQSLNAIEGVVEVLDSLPLPVFMASNVEQLSCKSEPVFPRYATIDHERGAKASLADYPVSAQPLRIMTRLVFSPSELPSRYGARLQRLEHLRCR